MIRAVKGTRDLLPPTTAVWNHVEAVAHQVFRVYNYGEIRTPLLEETALFARGVGEDTDIVSKEMYTFEDRDGTSLTLRPEATASVMRAYIEHRLDQLPGLTKLYYLGPMFRRERPQKGRYRQFYQIGAEAIGSQEPAVDAEVIELAVELLRRAGLESFQVLLNSVGCPKCRGQYLVELREKLRAVGPSLCADCQRRAVTNPLRVLDCKVPEDQPLIEKLPTILDRLCEECAAHFETVRRRLGERSIAFEVRPRLVRGLDYYMRTTFEIVHGALGAQNSVLGGGRYDGLAEALGSKVAAPGIGFSIGEDRLVMAVEETRPGRHQPVLDVFIVPIGPVPPEAPQIALELRQNDVSAEVSTDRLRKSLELADKLGARYTLLVGPDEVASGKYTLRDMRSGEQVGLTREELLNRLKPE